MNRICGKIISQLVQEQQRHYHQTHNRNYPKNKKIKTISSHEIKIKKNKNRERELDYQVLQIEFSEANDPLREETHRCSL